ncbi:hypothetical protein HPB48_014304 [Haemaphysalis longicornis]|uniref:Uncharacterized protein n=1 Tax=Haemaphysalis longicornis TaxID=44386 RepID=A0A9J6FIN4_HAELO|nr:hypothetical protein HPB48_014304 [Haemaphysalis longicornis]
MSREKKKARTLHLRLDKKAVAQNNKCHDIVRRVAGRVGSYYRISVLEPRAGGLARNWLSSKKNSTVFTCPRLAPRRLSFHWGKGKNMGESTEGCRGQHAEVTPRGVDDPGRKRGKPMDKQQSELMAAGQAGAAAGRAKKPRDAVGEHTLLGRFGQGPAATSGCHFAEHLPGLPADADGARPHLWSLRPATGGVRRWHSSDYIANLTEKSFRSCAPPGPQGVHRANAESTPRLQPGAAGDVRSAGRFQTPSASPVLRRRPHKASPESPLVGRTGSRKEQAEEALPCTQSLGAALAVRRQPQDAIPAATPNAMADSWFLQPWSLLVLYITQENGRKVLAGI